MSVGSWVGTEAGGVQAVRRRARRRSKPKNLRFTTICLANRDLRLRGKGDGGADGRMGGIVSEKGVRGHVAGVKCQVSGIRSQGSGTRCQGKEKTTDKWDELCGTDKQDVFGRSLRGAGVRRGRRTPALPIQEEHRDGEGACKHGDNGQSDGVSETMRNNCQNMHIYGRRAPRTGLSRYIWGYCFKNNGGRTPHPHYC